MPIQVNAEALREVLNVADSQTISARTAMEANDPDIIKIFGEVGIEKLRLLDTSIWMLRNALEKHDASMDKR